MAPQEANVAIYPITRTEEREGKFHWIAQVAPSDAVSLYRMKNNSKVIPNGHRFVPTSKKSLDETNRCCLVKAEYLGYNPKTIDDCKKSVSTY